MAGQIAEYLETDEILEWTDLEELLVWFNNSGFVDDKVYSIHNNSATSFRFLTGDVIDEAIHGTVCNQGSTIYFRPDSGSKIYVKGQNFNIAVSEIK